ncbi:MAG: radical SAM protein [Bacteroidota bacterium]
MKVLFTHAYFMYEDPKEQKVNRPYPPLGILYLSAWLEQHGYDNEVFDSTFSSAEAQRKYLLEQRPDVLAIYTNLMTKLAIVDLVRFIRSKAELKDTLVVLGGPDITYNIDNYLALGADVLIIGEGEQSMLEVVQACERGLRPHFGHIPGLAFRDSDGDTIRTAARRHLRQVDELPAPNRHKIDLSRYLEAWKTHHGRSSISVSTQRGCPFTCRWCSTAVYGQSYRRRSPALVAEEVAMLKETYNPDQLWFVDDVFTVNYKWLRLFHKEMQKRNLSVPFECITRAERLSEEIIGILKECGCFRIWIGAESGSQRVLDAMDRRVKAEQVQAMIIEAKQQEIETGTFIMLGYPGETEEDIQATLNHLRVSNPDLFTITVAYPIKGTGLYEDVKDNLVKEPDWFSSTDRDIDFQRTYARPYYDFAVRWVVNAVNLHKKRLEGKPFGLAAAKLRAKIALARLGMWWFRVFRSKGPGYGVSKSLPESSEFVLPKSSGG